MTRAHLDYTERRAPVAAQGFDADKPVAGFYRFRMRSGGVFVGVHIAFGPPLDPVTGEPLDRSWRFTALMNDAPIDVARVWPSCADAPCTEEEYRHLAGLQSWAKENAPNTAFADPRRKVDLLASTLPF